MYISDSSSKNYSSKVQRGTAVEVEIDDANAGGTPTLTLPMAIKQQQVDMVAVTLIKVDTDGYDADCLMSLRGSLSEVSPILYWENQIEQRHHFEKYQLLIPYLAKHGYTSFFLFDNFGNFLLQTNADGMRDMNSYLLRMAQQTSTRTFFYVDVLACKDDDYVLCQETIQRYVAPFTQR